MFTKKFLTDDEKFDEFMSSDFSKETLDNFIVSDIANKKNKGGNKSFWEVDDGDSSNSFKIGTGKSFLKSSKNIATPINVEQLDENIPEIVVKSDDNNDSQISELRLNLNHSSDKSQTSNINDEDFKNSPQFAHPMTFEGVTENMFDRSYSPTMEGDSQIKIHKLPKGIETMKSNISTIPIDKSHDNFNQSLDKTDKDHLLSKVSLLDSYDGGKVDKSIIKPDDLNSTGGFGYDNHYQDKSIDYDYKNSFNPASGDNYNNTQAITNVTDTVIGDTTAADLAAINKNYEKYNKDSLDFNPLSETIKDIYEDKTNHFDDLYKINLESTANSKSFGLKVIHPDFEESLISPVPTPRKRNKNKFSKSDNTELETIKDDSITSNSERKSETNDKVRPTRFSHVKSSGYGSKSTTPPNKTPVQNSSKSQPISIRKKFNQQILNPSTKLNNQTYTKSDQQTKSRDQSRSKAVPKHNENDRQIQSQLKNETYFISKTNTDEKINLFHQNSPHDNFNCINNEWQEKWLEERKIVKKLHADSVIQERDFKRQIETMSQRYEEKISQLESELNRTKQKLQMKPDFCNKLLGPDVTKEDIIRIEREMKEQNSILSAYEKDNEKLCQEIKILKQQKKGEDKIDSMENERLISQIVSLKAELDSKEIEFKNIKKMNKENFFSKNSGYRESKEFYLEEIADLKNELQNLNHRYLKSESEKQKSEMKLGKICTENEKTITHYKDELEIEKTERAKLKESHKIEVDDLKRKIKWYLENQSILDQNEKKLKMKDNELVDLRQQLNSASTMKISSNIRAKERLIESEKIKRLEDEVMSLKTDLYSLVKGKNIGNVAEKRTIQFLEEKIKSLELDNDMNSKTENNAIRSLQQQFEAMKFQYEEKIRDLEFDLLKKVDNKSHPEKLMRISDLRSKIDELNRELEKKSSIINKLKAEIKKFNKNNNDQIQNENKAKNIRKIEVNNRMEMLEKVLKEKENEIQRLTMHNAYFKNHERELDNNLSPTFLELEAENARYKSQIIHLNRESENYRNMVDEIKLSAFKNEELIREECRKEIRKCEEFHKENLNNVKMDFANRHSDSGIAGLQSQIEVQKTYINHLQSQTADYNIKLMSNEAKSNELIEAKQQIQNLKTELADLRLIWSKKPGLEMIDRLRTKIVQLEEKENFKGRQLDEYVEKMVRTHSKQYQDEVERWRLIVAKKNQNLIRVQHELDHLLEALEELRRQGIVIPKFSMKSRSLKE